ncbi:hypothetical protein CFR71_12660 [Novacetimonas pomaceti]|uniref:Uncharacterized protein n=1 Tax=Novacetimonas pomaceti TaxID=2021998 RepID=A0A318Q5M0_9PROT|nr:hypothetical protein CFR71_12660 [Novacetimonas pomaceti]
MYVAVTRNPERTSCRHEPTFGCQNYDNRERRFPITGFSPLLPHMKSATIITSAFSRAEERMERVMRAPEFNHGQNMTVL